MATIISLLGFCISLGISILIAIMWKRATCSKQITLNAEALRNPINMGVTVAGFLLPLIVGIMLLSYTNNSIPIYKGYFVFSSMLLIAISIFFGLWNNYSLATLTDDKGIFVITNTQNTYFPAFFVFQFSILFFGILFFALFGYNNIRSNEVNVISTSQESSITNNIFLSKPYIPVKTAANELVQYWGTPNKISNVKGITTYLYWTDSSEFIYQIKNDTIILINSLETFSSIKIST